MLHTAVLQRIRAEFLEMPGMQLTSEQLQRLCGVEQTLCRLVLDTLVDARFLCRSADGRYARTDGGELSRPHPAKADLRVQGRMARASRHRHVELDRVLAVASTDGLNHTPPETRN